MGGEIRRSPAANGGGIRNQSVSQNPTLPKYQKRKKGPEKGLFFILVAEACWEADVPPLNYTRKSAGYISLGLG